MNRQDEAEIDRNRERQMRDGTYTDDGDISRACKYCEKERPILSVADCCEKGKEEQDKRMSETINAISHVFGDYE